MDFVNPVIGNRVSLFSYSQVYTQHNRTDLAGSAMGTVDATSQVLGNGIYIEKGVYTPTTGNTIAIPHEQHKVIINPAGTIAR